MKLSTRLALAFFLLAVLPLGGIVTYTYVTSIGALRRTVEAQARAEMRLIEERMAVVRAAVAHRLSEAGALPLAALAGSRTPDQQVLDHFARQVAEVGPLLEGVEFVPAGESGSPTAVIAPRAHAGAVNIYVRRAPAPPTPPTSDVPTPPPPPQPAAPLTEAAEAMRRAALDKAAAVVAGRAVAAEAEQMMVAWQALEPERLAELEALRERSKALLGRSSSIAVHAGDRLLGHLYAHVRAPAVLAEVLRQARRDEGEIAFAIDGDGHVYAATAPERATLAALGVGGARTRPSADWLVVRTRDAAGGVGFGIARPIGKGLEELRRTAARNLAAGLLLAALAALGVQPLARRMTSRLSRLTETAGRLAEGNLDARVEVAGRDEIGRLGEAFNRMAADLEAHERRLLEQERAQHEREVRHRLLAADHERKALELDEARRFQLSLLPHALPEHATIEVAVAMRTATEVGGDYYDFRCCADDSLLVAIGDATGHGARAGTMVTVAKSLFTAAGEVEPAEFLASASSTVRRLGLPRMFMAMLVLRVERDGRGRLASAGMPPALLYRAAGGTVEEIAANGMPLGAFDGAPGQASFVLAPGDALLLMSDGFAELLDASGEPLGYERARGHFKTAAPEAAADAVGRLEQAALEWKAGAPLEDDVTFVVLRMKQATS